MERRNDDEQPPRWAVTSVLKAKREFRKLKGLRGQAAPRRELFWSLTQ